MANVRVGTTNGKTELADEELFDLVNRTVSALCAVVGSTPQESRAETLKQCIQGLCDVLKRKVVDPSTTGTHQSTMTPEDIKKIVAELEEVAQGKFKVEIQ